MGKVKKIVSAVVPILGMLGIMAFTAVEANAAPNKYQRWLDETAVIYTDENGVESRYTERQVGVPAFQEMMKQRFAGGIQPLTTWWNCPAGIGCGWTEFNGGGFKDQYSVGDYGTYPNCHYLDVTFANRLSSASADYGSGYDLKLFDSVIACVGGTTLVVTSSHSVNFSGVFASFNNDADFITIGSFG